MFFPANLLAQYWKNQTQQNYSLLHEKAASMLHYCMLWEKALVWTDEPTNRLLKCNNNEAECTDTWQTNWYIGNEAPRLIIAHYYGYHNAAHTLIMLFTDEVLFRQSSAAEMGNVDFSWFTFISCCNIFLLINVCVQVIKLTKCMGKTSLNQQVRSTTSLEPNSH